jgi:hypothetical protein
MIFTSLWRRERSPGVLPRCQAFIRQKRILKPRVARAEGDKISQLLVGRSLINVGRHRDPLRH